MSFVIYPDYFQPICVRKLLRPDLIGPPPDQYSLDYPDRLPEWLAEAGGKSVRPGAD